MFARIMAVVLTVILLLTGVLSAIGWVTLRDQQTQGVMEKLRTEAREGEGDGMADAAGTADDDGCSDGVHLPSSILVMMSSAMVCAARPLSHSP